MAITYETRQNLNKNSFELLNELSDYDLIIFKADIIGGKSGEPTELNMVYQLKVTEITHKILEKYRNNL